VKNELVTLAQELHDGIAQDLVVLGFSIDGVIAASANENIKSELRVIRFTITELIEKVRLEIHQLRSGTEPINSNATSNFSYEIQRVLAEIIRNIEQHSQATQLQISIIDNGIGGAQAKTGSFGIAGIQERMANLNGETLIESSENGTKIVLHIPLDKNDKSIDS